MILRRYWRDKKNPENTWKMQSQSRIKISVFTRCCTSIVEEWALRDNGTGIISERKKFFISLTKAFNDFFNFQEWRNELPVKWEAWAMSTTAPRGSTSNECKKLYQNPEPECSHEESPTLFQVRNFHPASPNSSCRHFWFWIRVNKFFDFPNLMELTAWEMSFVVLPRPEIESLFGCLFSDYYPAIHGTQKCQSKNKMSKRWKSSREENKIQSQEE